MPGRTRKPVVAKRGVSANLVITAVVVAIAAAIIGGALLINHSSTGGGAQNGRVSEQVLRRQDSHALSEATDKKATMVEFLDYQCPACMGYYTNVTKKLESDYNGRITFVTRNFPLNVHPLAMAAARAAEAAAAQGKYSQMYHALYDNYRQWAVAPNGGSVSDDADRARAQFDNYARQIGLDIDRFHRDVNSPEIAKRIDTDLADGQRAGITSTPSIFVNGKSFKPSGNSYADVDHQLRALLDRELGQ